MKHHSPSRPSDDRVVENLARGAALILVGGLVFGVLASIVAIKLVEALLSAL